MLGYFNSNILRFSAFLIISIIFILVLLFVNISDSTIYKICKPMTVAFFATCAVGSMILILYEWKMIYDTNKKESKKEL